MTACAHHRVRWHVIHEQDVLVGSWRCTDCGVEFGPVAERTTIAEPDTEQLAYERAAAVLYRHGRSRGQP